MLESTQTQKRNVKFYKVAVVLVTLLIGLLFYILNYYTPLYADDYSYAFSFSTAERMESISQIIDSQIAHYQYVNGRSITHTLAQVFLLVGDNAFNLINTVFFIMLLYLIYFHACGTFKKFSITKLSIIAMLLFLSSPAFGQSFLWMTGAANYLYGILIVLCCLLPYRIQVVRVSFRYSILVEILLAIVYLLLGMIAGWTNENTSVALIVMIIGYIIYFRIKSIKLHAWNITGGVGAVVGCILMLTSPGTASRLDSVGGSGGVVSWIKRMLLYSCDMLVNLQIIIFLFICVGVLYVYQKKLIKRSLKDATIILSECGVTIIYLLGFLASVYSMIVSPQFPERAWSGPIVLALISMIGSGTLVDMSDFYIKIGKKVVVVFALILSISTYVNALLELKNVDAAYDERVSIIENAILLNEKSVEIPNIYGWSGYSCYGPNGDLNSDSGNWPNTAIAQYYEIEEIKCND